MPGFWCPCCGQISWLAAVSGMLRPVPSATITLRPCNFLGGLPSRLFDICESIVSSSANDKFLRAWQYPEVDDDGIGFEYIDATA
jgi:hypothetical protein